MSSFDTLRMWEREQSRAFEELSYQLLKDRVPAGTRPIRTGNPDGGVEWYAVLPSGDEWGWQAKHVHGINPLLTAMTESVKRVATERPTLRKLTFVISWNLATSRANNERKSQRDKYYDKVGTWQTTIPGADKITFELIQGSDVLNELAKPQHEGRRWFWWGDVVLGPDWLRSHYQQQADAASEKYRPDLQVDIPIQEDLLAIGFDTTVVDHVRRLIRSVASAVTEQRSWPHDPDATLGPLFENAKDAALALHESAAALDLQAGDPPAALTDLAARLRNARDAVASVVQHERDAEAALRDLPADDPRKQQERPAYRRSDTFHDLVLAMRELSSWLASSPGRVLPRRAYFLTGEAGSGKTHLLLDATRRALDSGRPAVFLSGAQLGGGNLWASIADQLGLEPVGADVLLQAMDAAGEAAATCGSRFLIFIDALNETVPPDFWHRHLPALRSKVAQYPHVALVVSCRDTYQDLVMDDGERPHYQHRAHPGFADREVEATHTYFAHYGLEAPKIPLLTPEFTLPLFLRMYCESLSQSGTTTSHEGHQGRVTIFERYLAVKTATVTRRLTADATSGYERNAAAAQVTRVLDALLDEMAQRGSEGLTSTVAEAVARDALAGTEFKPVKVLGLLQEEGILTRERLYLDDEATYGEGIRVVFQAFADFLLLKRRLAASDDPRHDQTLAAWLIDECSWGIREAATILFPEAYGIELPDLLGITIGPQPARADDPNGWKKHLRIRQVYRSLVQTLPYRASEAVTERTIALLNDAIPVVSGTDVLRVLFTMAPQRGNRLNADRLHQNLAGLSMPQRDVSFGFATYHELFDESSPAARLARWAAAGPYPAYDPKVVELACIPLCWLLSSPNRYMRDWITKALTQLLHGHLDVMRALVERFWTVDDPYIVQRVVAVAYGSLLRSAPAHTNHARSLAKTVHTLVFTPPVRADELLLDAARGITRWAVAHTLLPGSAQDTARRPYRLEPPAPAPPATTIETTYGWKEDTPEDQNYSSIYFSVLSLGDFGRYVVESGLRYFSRHPIAEPYPDRPDRTPRFDTERWDTFVASLTPEQSTQLQDFLSAPDPHSMRVNRLAHLLTDYGADATTIPPLSVAPEDPLTEAQHNLLDAVWIYPAPVDDDYPTEPARRWVFQRTLDLGWTPRLFAAQDRTLGQGRGREGHKAERWGKKYQWIAWHELLARVADNYHAARRYDDDQPYDGLHQIIGDREIDPSLPPIDYRALTEDDGNGATAWQPPVIRLTEWPPANLDFTRYRGDIHRLLADTATEPTLARSLFVQDSDQTQWVVLESYIKKIDPAGHKSWRGLQEASMVDTLLIPAADARKFLTALAGMDRNAVHDLLDTHGHADCCYLGEVGRTGPRCYHRHDGFQPIEAAGKPFTIGRTVEAYAWEGNIQDCSIGETANVLLPSTLIQQQADLTFDMRGPSWLDPTGRPVFAYYQQDGNDSKALLVRASYLSEFLAQRQLELIVLHWFERMDLTGDHEGPFPSITVNVAARLTPDLTIRAGKIRREERDLD
ncbi:hypothetical protein [Micromonospora aurantiaca (nom. illeg.)]|uniref:hypothetical protein n=1 Tax=Micromonospora aurantiaca (nom. illeg.) TaxID=47850 RepID=UPI0035B35056